MMMMTNMGAVLWQGDEVINFVLVVDASKDCLFFVMMIAAISDKQT